MNLKQEWTDIKLVGFKTWFIQAPINVKIAAVTTVLTIIALAYVGIVAVL